MTDYPKVPVYGAVQLGTAVVELIRQRGDLCVRESTAGNDTPFQGGPLSRVVSRFAGY